MKRVLLLFFLSAIIFTKSYSQYAKGQMKEDFYEAEMFILYEEYKEALPTYERLLVINPINTNYKYRIGQCLINIDGRKKEAIRYLEAAVKNMTHIITWPMLTGSTTSLTRRLQPMRSSGRISTRRFMTQLL
jgi:tetratricopeptide (TPR) repeat protein